MSTDETTRYESFPKRVVVLSNSFSLSIYAIGALVLWLLTPLASVLFLGYCFVLELRVLKHSCPSCYYYGKTCCFGKGIVCSYLFKKREPRRFIERKVTWLDILPDFMVTVLPVLGGIIVLSDEFSWIVLALILTLPLLGFQGSAFIRGSYACRYCRQRDLGCPALNLFERKKSEGKDKTTSKR